LEERFQNERKIEAGLGGRHRGSDARLIRGAVNLGNFASIRFDDLGERSGIIEEEDRPGQATETEGV
jgi:hypothetical protein